MTSDGKFVFRQRSVIGALAGSVFFYAGLGFQIIGIVQIVRGEGIRINDELVTEGPALLLPILFPAVFWSIGLLILLSCTLPKTTADEVGIRSRGYLGKSESLRWSEVESYQLHKRGKNQVTLSGSGKKLRWRRGWPLLNALIVRHLSGSALVDLDVEDDNVPAEKRPSINNLPPLNATKTFRKSSSWGNLAFGLLWTSGLIWMMQGAFGFASKSGADNLEAVGFFPILLAFLAIGFWLILSIVERVELDEQGLRYFNCLNRCTDSMYWSDIEGFEHESSSKDEDGTSVTYGVRSRDHYFEITNQFGRFEELRDQICARIPAGARVNLA